MKQTLYERDPTMIVDSQSMARHGDKCACGATLIASQGVASAGSAAARNAMCGGEDFSNGAYFWDGADIKSNYSNHFKVKHGIQFTEPQHNIYGVQPSTMKTVFLYRNKKSRINGKTVIEKQLIDSADHVYESTAAYGGTIFWKQSTHYLNVTRAKPWL